MLIIKVHNPILQRVLRFFRRKTRFLDPHEVLIQARNVESKGGHFTNSEIVWTPEKIKTYKDSHVEVIQ